MTAQGLAWVAILLPGCALIDGLGGGDDAPDSSPFDEAVLIPDSLPQPEKVAVGDFDDAPPIDILVASVDGTFEVFTEARPDFGFAVQGPLGARIGSADDVGLGDINGDRLGEAIIRSGDVVHIDAQGATINCPFSGATKMIVRDVDDDGLRDLLVARDFGSPPTTDLQILFGEVSQVSEICANAPQLSLPLPARGISIQILDHDNDGDRDIAVLLEGEAGIQIFDNLQNDTGVRDLVEGSLEQWALPGDFGQKIVVGDFDGDLNADLAVAVLTNNGDLVRIGAGFGGGSFGFFNDIEVAQQVALGDMVPFRAIPGGPRNAIAGAHVPGDEEGVFLAISPDPDFEFDEGTVSAGFAGQPRSLGFADLDGDGIEDLFGPVAPNNQMAFLFSRGL